MGHREEEGRKSHAETQRGGKEISRGDAEEGEGKILKSGKRKLKTLRKAGNKESEFTNFLLLKCLDLTRNSLILKRQGWI